MARTEASGMHYDEEYPAAECEVLRDLIGKLRPALRPKGTIRVSSILKQTARYLEDNAERLFPDFNVKARIGDLSAIFERR